MEAIGLIIMAISGVALLKKLIEWLIRSFIGNGRI